MILAARPKLTLKDLITSLNKEPRVTVVEYSDVDDTDLKITISNLFDFYLSDDNMFILSNWGLPVTTTACTSDELHLMVEVLKRIQKARTMIRKIKQSPEDKLDQMSEIRLVCHNMLEANTTDLAKLNESELLKAELDRWGNFSINAKQDEFDLYGIYDPSPVTLSDYHGRVSRQDLVTLINVMEKCFVYLAANDG